MVGQDMMNGNDSQLVHSNRPASRRLHRRLAFAAAAPCTAPASRAVANVPEPILALPQNVVRDAGMFELLAAQLRIAELEKALAVANEAAIADPLTGALNRRGFNDAYLREMARARRSGVPFALALIDLDDFKHLNDTLGHHAGDKVLVRLVEVLRKSMRPSDEICRLGGEEFVLMLHDASLSDAAAAVSRFLGEYSRQRVPGIETKLTFSAGVVMQRLDESFEQVMQRADVAAYAAKRAGKNRVVTG
jgi:diguanylate cyclase